MIKKEGKGGTNEIILLRNISEIRRKIMKGIRNKEGKRGTNEIILLPNI